MCVANVGFSRRFVSGRDSVWCLLRMAESYELEEGEWNCSANDDLDVDLSYIDKKIQNVLGHFQRSVNMFGPKIYDYGSFLPTYKRSTAVPPCQRSSMANNAVQRFPNNLPVKNVVQKFQSLPATSCKSASILDSQTNQTSGSLLPQAPGKVIIKKEDAKIPGNGLSDHKPIRVRIKMGSKILSQKVTMVCNDLGLNDSPNSPTRNSHDSSSRMLPHTAQEKTSESPSRILQEMTAIPVPEDLMMSPLPDNLLNLKEKEKRDTLLGNEPVTKAGKVPFTQTQNKFSYVLGCGETPSGRKRKAVDCFNATSLNESLSTGEVKKQKVSSTGPLAMMGGINSHDGFTTKSNLQKGIKKDVESDGRVAFAKSNKMKVVGKIAEKEKKTYPIKLQQNSSKSSYGGDKVLSKMPAKDTANIIQNSVGTGLAPSSTSLDFDSWAQCDSCKTWRLLPFVPKPDDLPEKWVCSMQTWLPAMNLKPHCGLSEEETTNAIKSLHVAETSNAEKSYQSLPSVSLPNLIERNHIMKDLSQGISSNILVDAAKPVRSTSHALKIRNTKLPLKTHNAAQISTDFCVSQKFAQDNIDQKAKGRPAGTGGIQIKIKKEKESDNQESESSKKIKTGVGNKLSRDVKADEIHCKQDLDCTPGGRKKKRQDDDFYTLDAERATKKRIIASKKKPDNQPQPTTGSGSLCIKAQGNINSPVRNRNQPKPEVCKQSTSVGDLPCTSMKTVLEDRGGIKSVNAITHETMDRSPQAANDILQEAEKQRKLADYLKVAVGYDDKSNKTNFNAALKFLRGASLLEMSSASEKVEEGRMSHVEGYHTAAKLSESCARQYETNKEMSAAALAYKCMEVACMRVVYCKSPGLSGEWNQLHKMVQMTAQGESPSSSASDIDTFCHQGVIDKSAKTKRGLSLVVGNILPVARRQQSFVPLLEFTEIMNMAMEASAKSQHAFGAVITSEETKHKDCVSAIKKVVDFSFHDVEALIQMIEVARRALSSSKVRAPKC